MTGTKPLRSSKVLLVGIMCFGLWFLVDAGQLYRNAVASPLGTRRSVAMSILRPFAKLDDVLGVSGVISAADGLLGRHGTVGGSVARVSQPLAMPRRSEGAGKPLHAGSERTDPSPPANVEAWPPPLAQPTVSHPLVLLEIGDSLGEDLGFGLSDVLSGSEVQIHDDAVGDTGLARPDYYNWPAELDTELAQYHPQVVVVLLGANDAQSFAVNGEVVSYGTPAWRTVYAARVSEMMNEATEDGAHLLWVGLPIMASSTLSSDAQTLNQIYVQQTAIHPGVTYFASWSLFTTANGSYSAYLPSSSGTEELLRDPDGIHLTGAGDDRLAHAMVPAMEETWHIKL
jgi:hypothetical protein